MKYKESVFNISFSNNAVYNSYSGAIMRLDKPVATYLTEDVDTKPLVEQGLVVPAQINEINKFVLERNAKIYSRHHRGLKYVIALTNDCQAHCNYCFEKGIDRSSYMSLETAEKVVRYIAGQMEQSVASSVQVTFFGGEPLMNFEVLSYLGTELHRLCGEKNTPFVANIITNGIALDTEKAKAMASFGVKFAQITLDGTREEYKQAKGVDAFDIVINNITQAASILPIDIRLNITRDNAKNITVLIDELLNTHDLAGKVQITLAQVVDYVGCQFNSALCLDNMEYAQYLRDSFIAFSGHSKKSLRASHLLPKVLRTFCGMENCMQFVIGTDGELYKCEHNVGKPAAIVGDIEVGPYYSDLEMSFYSQIPEKCVEERCPFLPMCLGGCVNERVHNNHIRDCEQVKKKYLMMLETYLTLVH